MVEGMVECGFVGITCCVNSIHRGVSGVEGVYVRGVC